MMYYQLYGNVNTWALKVFLILLVPPLCIANNRGQNTADKSLYPIRNLQASLTASEGYGTVAAVRASYNEGDDCVLIVSYSPSESNCNLTRSFWDSTRSRNNELESDVDSCQEDFDDDHGLKNADNDKVELFMTPVVFRGAVVNKLSQRKRFNQKQKETESKLLHILHEKVGICLAMTGFASDVKHLVRYIANVIAEYEYLYGGEVPSTHSLVRDSLASYMRDSSAGRPFGVQCLIVGNEYGNMKDRGKIKIFTVDPSGNFRHCIAGVAAIGRNRQGIQDSLFKALKFKSNRQSSSVIGPDLQTSLDMAISSILENTFEDEELSSTSKSTISVKFEAVVVFGRGSSKSKPYSCSILNQPTIQESCHRCLESLKSKHKLKP